MTTFLIILHVLVCIALILIVLLQAGKGAEVGAAFGAGASGTVFGARGAGSFLGKMTGAAAVIFMLTSLILSYFSGQPGSSSVMPDVVAPAQQEAPAPPPSQGATPAATPDQAPALPAEESAPAEK
ncbi:MAG: preprotein translocase subunit SecG [Thermodesulfobacteriota bacterium]|jgi:preprotein translocase subunit SecG|nr:preprotein translocase subunit SecG [Thermodesulfobacteriota bacterium]